MIKTLYLRKKGGDDSARAAEKDCFGCRGRGNLEITRTRLVRPFGGGDGGKIIEEVYALSQRGSRAESH